MSFTVRRTTSAALDACRSWRKEASAGEATAFERTVGVNEPVGRAVGPQAGAADSATLEDVRCTFPERNAESWLPCAPSSCRYQDYCPLSDLVACEGDPVVHGRVSAVSATLFLVRG